MEKQEKTPRLLDQVRAVMRLHHYSLHTERAYVEWIRRFVRFHGMQRRKDLAGGEAKIEAFLTDLAVNGGGVGPGFWQLVVHRTGSATREFRLGRESGRSSLG